MSGEKWEELINGFTKGKFTRKEFIKKSIMLGISMSTIGARLFPNYP